MSQLFQEQLIKALCELLIPTKVFLLIVGAPLSAHVKFLPPICNDPPSDLVVADGGDVIKALGGSMLHSRHVGDPY